MIKVINQTNIFFWNFAHFMFECLFPEINLNLHNEDLIMRKNSVDQTLGIYLKLYEEIMGVKVIEVSEKEFSEFPAPLRIVKSNTKPSLEEFDNFRNYMFSKFPIKISPRYAPILLIQRGCNKTQAESLDISEDQSKTGYESREIKDIEILKSFLKENYPANHECIVLEEMPIQQQMEYFVNAKIIIGAHGAGLSNTLFCQPETCVIEVDCVDATGGSLAKNWEHFRTISTALKLKHLLCPDDLDQIKKALEIEFNARIALW